MKKVLLISHFPPPTGGIATWTKRVLALGLPDGWEIDHINSNLINGRTMANKRIKFKDEYIRSRNIWKKEIEFLKNDPDIKVVHTCIPCTVFGMIRETITAKIAKKYKKKFILHCHSTVPNVVNSKFKRIFWKILTKYCDGIITLNSRSYEFAKQYAPKCLVRTIPNFVLEENLIGENKIIAEKVKNIAYVGGVCEGKGCDDIVYASKFFPDINFNLIGLPSDGILNLEKGENVILHGCHDVDYVKEELKKNDMFLFPSKYFGEGFSVALTEAMAAGLPCVVTNWAANADMIEDKGGIVIEKGDKEALVSAIKTLCEDKNLREQASKFNFEKAKNQYIADAVLKSITDFYQDVLKEKNK